MAENPRQPGEKQDSFGVHLRDLLEEAGISTLSTQKHDEKVAVARVLKLIFQDSGYTVSLHKPTRRERNA